jgi:hypothetical protein
VLAACLALGTGCPDLPNQPRPPTVGPAQKASARQTLATWFECEECVDGELQDVLALGPLALPSLARALLEGPSPAALFSVERALRLRYRELDAFASSTPGARFSMGQDEFVDAYRANYMARLQGRAAWALGEIEDPAAEHALRKALGTELRPDVQRAVQAALDRRARTP